MVKKSELTALMIDDDPVSCKAMDFALKKFGIHPMITSTPTHFLEMAKKATPSLFLVDLNLGELGSGFDLILELRKNYDPRIPIIVISGESANSAVTQALDLGANDYITKPLDRQFLASKLSRYVHTEEISDHQASFVEVTDSEDETKLTVSCEIEEVDELGVRICGPQLFSKGSAFYLEGEFVFEMTQKRDPLLLTIHSTWVDSQQPGCYAAYAEFDQSNTELLQSVRRWLNGMCPLK